MGCGGCGRRSAPVKGVAPKTPPAPLPPPMKVAPVVRSLTPRQVPKATVPPPPSPSNIVLRTDNRKCSACGQPSDFQLKWNDKLRRYYEVSLCPCTKA